MMLTLKLHPKYWSLVDTYKTCPSQYYICLCPKEIRALAKKVRLQILKTFEAQEAPDALVSKVPYAKFSK